MVKWVRYTFKYILFTMLKLRKKVFPSVDCNRTGIVYTRSIGQLEEVTWNDLQSVIIETTTDGPFLPDVFWVLVGNNRRCVIPSETKGEENLLKRLQKLPGFDNQAVIDAMSCTENKNFLCWKRPVIDDVSQ